MAQPIVLSACQSITDPPGDGTTRPLFDAPSATLTPDGATFPTVGEPIADPTVADRCGWFADALDNLAAVLRTLTPAQQAEFDRRFTASQARRDRPVVDLLHEAA